MSTTEEKKKKVCEPAREHAPARMCVHPCVCKRVCVCLTCSIWRIRALGGCHTIGRRKPAEG